MNKGLDLIKRQQPEFINDFPTGNICIGVTKEELDELEKELKEHEQHKAIEEELGIDLVTLIKALKDGVYLWNENREIIFSKIEHFVPLMDKQLHTRGKTSIIHGVYSRQKEKHLAIKDYGETWALTKEELL